MTSLSMTMTDREEGQGEVEEMVESGCGACCFLIAAGYLAWTHFLSGLGQGRGNKAPESVRLTHGGHRLRASW